MKNKTCHFYHTVIAFLWDLWCIISIIGIWPRFIEPSLLTTSNLSLPITSLPIDLQGLTILFFSDLHFNNTTSQRFLRKLSTRIKDSSPDIIIFGGDLLTSSRVEERERLKTFLQSLHAPYGCYCVFGNHDYAQWVSLNNSGEYDLKECKSPGIISGFKRLFSTIIPRGVVTERARNVSLHNDLPSLFSDASFTILENASVVISIKNSYINICGLGEYSLGRSDPVKAFEHYDNRYPGIVVTHNPDSFPMISDYPSSIVLSGHTHGGQVNIPWMWRKLTPLENPEFKRGIKKRKDKTLFISRGVGSSEPFRWFSPPEITVITLESSYHEE